VLSAGPVLDEAAMRSTPLLALFAAALLAAAACGDQSSSSAPGDADAGGTTPPGQPPADAAAPPDAGTDADEPLPKQTEAEPNNGGTTTELNAMTIPGEMDGKIDPANDVDIFGLSLSPGELWEWTVTPTSQDLAPHLTVFDTAPNNLNPTRLVAGQPGGPATLEHFVLRAGTFVAAVRDTRNVPDPTGKGGPTYGYSLVAKKKTASPTAVTFPSTKSATLGSLSSIDLYTFTGTGGKGCDIVIKAARKTVPSTLDSRLSLFDVAGNTTLITNDDASGTTDSQISSASPLNGTYIIVVENEGTNGGDLSYDLELTLKP
jgi:hypothetical protein